MDAKKQINTLVNALSYKKKKLVIDHITELLLQMTSLTLNRGKFHFNNGQQAEMVTLVGTIPIYYHRARYNIPVKIWILPDYPDKAPMVYVDPTKDMRIKRGHPNVDADGLVYMNYTIWRQGSSLSTLCGVLSQKFSQQPPVYKATPKKPVVAQRPVVRSRVQPYGGYGAGGAAQRRPQPAAAWSGRQQGVGVYNGAAMASGQPDPARSKALMKDNLLRQARQLLTSRAHSKIEEQTEEIRRLMDYESKLKQGELYLAQSVERLEREKTRIGASLQVAARREAELEAWLKENETKSIPIDELVVGSDTWSRQIITECARDGAIEDALYALAKDLESGRIEISKYLKKVRELSKRQFQHRYLSLKIMEKQRAKSAMNLA